MLAENSVFFLPMAENALLLDIGDFNFAFIGIVIIDYESLYTLPIKLSPLLVFSSFTDMDMDS